MLTKFDENVQKIRQYEANYIAPNYLTNKEKMVLNKCDWEEKWRKLY